MNNDDNDNSRKPPAGSEQDINAAIRYACRTQFGVLDSGFLCQSVGILPLKQSVCLSAGSTVAEVIAVLTENKIGCVMITDDAGRLAGIFTERDCLLKVVDKEIDLKTAKISDYMAPNPVSQPPDCTIAYALNLMSAGGFRHLPITDKENVPVSILSVKDLVDHIVNSFTEDLLSFDTQGGLEQGGI